MKTIIAGCRHIYDINFVDIAVKKSKFVITEVVCGKAKGIDKAGEDWGDKNNIEVKSFYANWTDSQGNFDRGGGHKRNTKMAEYADALVAIWDGISPGTKHMISEMKRLQKRYYIFRFDLYKEREDMFSEFIMED